MSRSSTIAVLLFAALLEAGGDAIIRSALRTSGLWRALLMASGGIVLFAYGYTVNTPPWDFGRLLGLYVVFFFAFAQIISWAGFRQPPSMSVVAGGALIVAGALVIAFGSA